MHQLLHLLFLTSLTLPLMHATTSTTPILSLSLTRRQSQICFIEPLAPNDIYTPCGNGYVLTGCICCTDGVTPCASSSMLQTCQDSATGSMCVDSVGLVESNCAQEGLDTCQFADGSTGCCEPSYSTAAAVTPSPAAAATTAEYNPASPTTQAAGGGGSAAATTNSSQGAAVTSNSAVARLTIPKALSGGMLLLAVELSL